MLLSQLLKGMDYEIIKGNVQTEISTINYDSRKVGEHSVFFCITGYVVDGHDYALKAIELGAKVIIIEKDIKIKADCTVIRVSDTRKAMALCAANYYGNPASKLKIIGITGTKGKTTTSFMIKHILKEAGYKVAILGTIANYIGEKKLKALRTTPESLDLHELFNIMVEEKMDYCIMEVSSHSLYLNRVYGINFCEAVFTNLSQDHLDFHETFENYYAAKLLLFEKNNSSNGNNAVINIDDKYGMRAYKEVGGNKTTFAIEKEADLRAKDLKMHSRGVSFNLEYKGTNKEVNMHLPGRYNVLNAIGSMAACLNEGIELDTVIKGIFKLESVPGRCEIVSKKYGLDFEIILDYAHTPDSLLSILQTVREFTTGRLITVFGCGGDRDKTKRPIMGKIGTELSDLAIITSDNPRSEEPMNIINEIISGIEKKNYEVVENRKIAIEKAIMQAKKDDLVIIVGKGHEDYQILKNETIHFDEREVIAEIMKKLGKN